MLIDALSLCDLVSSTQIVKVFGAISPFLLSFVYNTPLASYDSQTSLTLIDSLSLENNFFSYKNSSPLLRSWLLGSGSSLTMP